jgi:hypothetical protein
VVKEAFQQPAPGEPRPAAEVRSANAAAEEQADANSAAQVGHS